MSFTADGKVRPRAVDAKNISFQGLGFARAAAYEASGNQAGFHSIGGGGGRDDSLRGFKPGDLEPD